MPPRFEQRRALVSVSRAQLDLPHGDGEALRHAGQGRDLAALQRRLGALEEKRVAERAAPDHRHVRAGEVQYAHRVLRLEHVAVGDDGDGHRLLDLTDGRPVRRAAVHLRAGAPVHRDCRHADGFQSLR